MLKCAPEGMRFNPSGLRRRDAVPADREHAFRRVPVLDHQRMRAKPARSHAAKGCDQARLFSRELAAARNSHFASNNLRVTTAMAVWRPCEPRVYRACQRQMPSVTTPLSATPRSVVTPAASASPQGFSGINPGLTQERFRDSRRSCRALRRPRSRSPGRSR